MRKKILISAAAVALLAGSGLSTAAVADTHEPQSVPDPVLDQKALEDALDNIVENGGQSVVAQVKDNHEFWGDASGPRENGGDEMTKRDDQVRVGSLTKSMVTTVLFQLVEDGQLDIDAPVAKYLPGVLPYEQEITVRQLMGHTSGVPDYFAKMLPSLYEGSADGAAEEMVDEYAYTDLIDKATSDPLLFEPDEDWSYSNTGYYVLGLLVEEITGESVDTNLTARVFAPLHLDQTYLQAGDDLVIDADHPTPYLVSQDGDLTDTDKWHPSQSWAAGAVISTMDDINTFYRAMFDGTLLEPASVKEATTLTPQSGEAYGLGIQAVPIECDAVPGGTVYGHTGGTLGHSTWSFHSPNGQRQMTLTYSVDDQLKPSKDLNKAVNDFAIVALCGGQPQAQGETPQVMLPNSVLRG